MQAFKVEGNVYFSLYIEVSLLPHLISELGNEANAIAVFVTGKKGERKKKKAQHICLNCVVLGLFLTHNHIYDEHNVFTADSADIISPQDKTH